MSVHFPREIRSKPHQREEGHVATVGSRDLLRALGLRGHNIKIRPPHWPCASLRLRHRRAAGRKLAFTIFGVFPGG